jgi:chemotaxis protein methyltransferase CheR
MAERELNDFLRQRLSAWIEERLGLHFPRDRWNDLERGVASAADELGFARSADCAEALLSPATTAKQLEVLTTHLAIGETYFFREPQTLDILARQILPDLIARRRGKDQRLRLWSAACCTGEEPYSLAILLHQLLPDLKEWHVTVRATDVNPRFLEKAAEGSYGAWSFRAMPAGYRERYFSPNENGQTWTLHPEIKRLVTFAPLNLVEGAYPSRVNNTDAMDVIFCRNVLIYFSPAQTSKVIGRLHRALADDGWLVVGPSETSQALFADFVTRIFPGVVLYQKSKTDPDAIRWGSVKEHPARVAATSLSSAIASSAADTISPKQSSTPIASLRAAANSLYAQGRYDEAIDRLLDRAAEVKRHAPSLALLGRCLANIGKLEHALAWCDRWIAAEKLEPAAHYLRATILIERGHLAEARRSLRRAVYLRPEFVLAHFVLGNLARDESKAAEARRHYDNARELLARCAPDEILPESDGISARQLADMIASVTDDSSAMTRLPTS